MRYLARTAAETEALGAALARALPQPLTAASVVHLRGDLGAGKTTFARGFMRGSGFEGAVRSPTYTLLECYELSAVCVVHIDLYRLRAPQDWEGLGLRDLTDPRHLWLVEWPERGGALLPPADVQVELTVAPGGHQLQWQAASDFGRRWLQQLEPPPTAT